MNHKEKTSGASPACATATKKRLMEAATEEFYRSGYRRANLRSICKACGVTTGAFYFSFSGKQELFQAIVDPVISKLFSLSEELVLLELADPSMGQETSRKIMEFELRYRKELIILLDKSEGSGREHTAELLYQRMLHYFTLFFEKELGHPPDPAIIRLLVGMRMYGNLSLLKENYDMERTLFYNDVLNSYADGGFEHLIQQFKNRL